MTDPRRRLVAFGYVVAFTASLFVVGFSSIQLFMSIGIGLQISLWVCSLIMLIAVIVSYRTNAILHPPSQSVRDPYEHCSDLLNAVNHGIVVTDEQLVITYANTAFAHLIANDNHGLLGKPIADVFLQTQKVQPSSISYRLALLARSTRSEQATTLDLPIDDHRFYHIHITATPILTSTQSLSGVLLVYEDRTAERELQETVRRHDQLETVSQMAASIAHEVRNPMTSVQGFLQLMSQQIDPAHAHSMYLHVMEEDLKRINSIITEYLNFSRMGSDSLEDVWIGTLLHNTYTLLQSEANLKGIDITLSMLGNNPLVIANPNRLKQVLINLARNAMEAMSERGGVLTLSLETTESYICLQVKDTGPGIPADMLTQIFHPYYTTKPTGTGLGLFICKQIIEEHNGTIEVESALDVGTTFTIRLPKNRFFESQ